MAIATRFGPQEFTDPKPPVFYDCGICGQLHPVNWDGDCRDDDNRFTEDELDGIYGEGGYETVPMSAVTGDYDYVWVRMGDNSEYRCFDSIAEAAQHISEFGVSGDLQRKIYGAVDDGAYTGNNYISLFWGDEDANPGKELDAEELAELNREIRK